MINEITKAIRDEAADCLESSKNNGKYNESFYTCYMMLISLVDKLDKIEEAKGNKQ
jgi:hypothetical protein